MISIDLHVIEESSMELHRSITNSLCSYGIIFENTYEWIFNPAISLPFALWLAIDTLVEEQPNLHLGEERLAGVIKWVNGKPHIHYEAYDLHTRQRFSIAHELGHFALHAKQRRDCACAQPSVDPQNEEDEPPPQPSNVEREADAFAAAFLMPHQLLTADIVRFGRCVAFLAARYRVSDPAMRRRLRQLGASQ